MFLQPTRKWGQKWYQISFYWNKIEKATLSPSDAFWIAFTGTIVSMESATQGVEFARHRPTNIAVIGGGYVGLPTAAVLARYGYVVTLAESDPRKLRSLSEEKSPQFEDGLGALMHEGVSSGNLKFVSNDFDAVSDAKITFVCVPTPQADDGTCDMSHLIKAVTSFTSLFGSDRGDQVHSSGRNSGAPYKANWSIRYLSRIESRISQHWECGCGKSAS